MIPSSANSDYPKFVPDQVLTSDNLNDLFGYLDEQERITRTNLLGIGIVCGLQVKTGVDGDGRFLIITRGTGVTSQGYLVTIPEIKYYYYNRFNAVQCQFYDPFVTNATRKQKFLLWELKQKGDTEPQDNLFHQLNDPGNFLADRVVMLFVELFETNNKNCDPNSCDDKGIMVTVNFRPLLVLKSDAPALMAQSNTGVSASSIASFPDLVMHRWDVPNTKPVTAGNLVSAYKSILSQKFIHDVQRSLSNTYSFIFPINSYEYPEDPFEKFNLVTSFSFLYNGNFTRLQLLNIQYYYDFFSDLVEAYNEFCQAGNEVISCCCPDELLFPRHLLLGEALQLPYDAPSAFRHEFRYSPLFQRQELLLKLKALFRRMDLMLKNLQMPPAVVSGTAKDDLMIRITPDNLSDIPLSLKALPYYYTPDISPAPLRKFWSLSKKPSQVLSYNTDPAAVDDFIKNPLAYDLEPYNFFRIEGITGKDISSVLTTLKTRIEKYRLPFKVVALATGTPGKSPGDDDCCNFADLELQFRLLRKEILYCLEQNISFWGAFEKKKDDNGTIRIVRPDYSKYIRGEYRMADGRVILAGQEPSLNVVIGEVQQKQVLYSTEAATAQSGTRNRFIAANFAQMPEESLAGLYLDYQRKTVIGMGNLPAPKTNATEENLPYYILILLDESDHLAALLETDKIAEFDAEAFITHAGNLGDACANLKELIDAYKATEYLVAKIRVNASGYLTEIDKIAEALPVMSSEDANNIILLLNNLEQRGDFIDQLQRNSGNYAAQHSVIAEFYRMLDKNGMQNSLPREPAGKLGSKYSKMAEHLKMCMCGEKIDLMECLLGRYKEQRDKLEDISNFSVYLKKHPGISHKAGVTAGGTFLLVYKGATDQGQEIETNTVVADFYLPYTCTSNCTPVEVTVQEAIPPKNLPPNAKAGDTVFVQLPVNSASLDGSYSSDPDGTISQYLWEKVSGPLTGTLTNAASPLAAVSNLVAGTYVYKLTVTDNSGAVNSDTVTINVMARPNNPPRAVAETDKANITLPATHMVTLTGQNSSDPDAGASLTFSWSIDAGTQGAVISAKAAMTTPVNFSKTGLYVFKLTVTDQFGATGTDKVFVLVNEIPNKTPVARGYADPGSLFYASGKKVVTILNGENSEDPDGNIIYFNWSLPGNTGTAIIAKPQNSVTEVTFNEPGNYLFTLTVTDQKGAFANDYVLVTVKEQSENIACASLTAIIQRFFDLPTVDTEKVFAAFRQKYEDYSQILDFYKSLQENGIASLPVAEQVTFFKESGIENDLERWIGDLGNILKYPDIKLLALNMLSIHARLAYYIACIQKQDIDSADVPMAKALETLDNVLAYLVTLTAPLTPAEKGVLNELLTITTTEKSHLIQRDESTVKPKYLRILGALIETLTQLNR